MYTLSGLIDVNNKGLYKYLFYFYDVNKRQKYII